MRCLIIIVKRGEMIVAPGDSVEILTLIPADRVYTRTGNLAAGTGLVVTVASLLYLWILAPSITQKFRLSGMV
jgi:hypothetical protein